MLSTHMLRYSKTLQQECRYVVLLRPLLGKCSLLLSHFLPPPTHTGLLFSPHTQSDTEASPCGPDDSPTHRFKHLIAQSAVGTETAMAVGFDTLAEDMQEKHDETTSKIGHVADRVDQSERNQVERHEESERKHNERHDELMQSARKQGDDVADVKGMCQELLQSNKKLQEEFDLLKTAQLAGVRRNLLLSNEPAADGTNAAYAAAVPACIVSKAGNPVDDASTAASTQSSLTQPSTEPSTRPSTKKFTLPSTPSSKGQAKAQADGGKENNGRKMSRASATKSSRHEASVQRFLRQKMRRREQDEIERSAGLDRNL